MHIYTHIYIHTYTYIYIYIYIYMCILNECYVFSNPLEDIIRYLFAVFL